MTMREPLHPDAVALLQTLDESQPGSVSKLVRLFAADAPALLARIELGYERGDLAEINQAAHYLRSSALAVGTTALAEAALRLEHLPAEQLQSDQTRDHLAQLRASLRGAILSLLEYAPGQ
jgi:HPt (histidine-containing phosphotransfer) domain-containing protein